MIYIAIAHLFQNHEENTTTQRGHVIFTGCSTEEQAKRALLSNPKLIDLLIEGWGLDSLFAIPITPEEVLSDKDVLCQVATALAKNRDEGKQE